MPTRSTWKSGSTRRNTTSHSMSSGSRTSGTYRNHSSTSNRSSHGYSTSSFNTHRNEICAKICSFRTINQQLNGAGKVTTFSPGAANKWINFVNDGARVYKFTNLQMARIFGSDWSNNNSTTNTLRLMKKKFGSGIKAVTKGKSSTWLVAATNNVSKRPFSTYSFSN